MKVECQHLETASIRLGDETYRISTRRPLAPLVDSIGCIGLINPPLVIPQGNGYRIICGFRRVKACQRLSLPEIPVRRLPAETSGERCLEWAIADNTSQRRLNLVETSRALNKLKARLPGSAGLAETAAMLGLPGDRRMIDKILPICHFGEPIQEGVVNGSLALPMALELGRMPAGDGDALAAIFQLLRLNLNRQREMLLYIKEIALRDEVDLADVYASRQVREIVQDPELDTPRKARRLRSLLRSRRFPALDAVEKDFEKKTKALKPSPGVTVVPPPSFESPTYQIKLSFDSLSQLKKRLSALEAMSASSAFAELFRR